MIEDPAHLITIVGPGGIGKTRLALALAAFHVDSFADGVAFVALAPVRSAAVIAPTILSMLGVQLQGQRDPCEQLHLALREPELLLVLDNLEQLLAPAEQTDDVPGS